MTSSEGAAVEDGRRWHLGTMILSASLAAGSNLMLRYGMSNLEGDLGEGAALLLGLLSLPVLIGLTGYAVSYALWLHVLSQAKLAAAYPIYVSSLVVMVLLGSTALLGETLSAPRVGSAVLVTLGIIVAEWRRGT